MKVSKYRVTIAGRDGSAVIVYENDTFKSVLSDFKPPLNDDQLNWTLSHIPATEVNLGSWLVDAGKGKVHVEHLSVLAPNQVIAMFCQLYELRTGVKYKVSGSDAGKITTLSTEPVKWQVLLEKYFSSENFLFKGKYSVANLAKYFNELNVEVFGVKPGKTYPLPYDQDYFAQLNFMQQKEYHKFLHDNGYRFQHNPGRGGKWIKEQFI